METTQERIVGLVKDTFTDKEVFGVAMYLLCSNAVAEAAQSGILRKEKTVKGIPPMAVEMMYKYDSALVTNEFYLKNYAVIKSLSILDKVKLSCIPRLTINGIEEKDERSFQAAKQLILSQFDSLILVAFLWKGFKFATNFTTKLHVIIDLSDDIDTYFEERFM